MGSKCSSLIPGMKLAEMPVRDRSPVLEVRWPQAGLAEIVKLTVFSTRSGSDGVDSSLGTFVAAGLRPADGCEAGSVCFRQGEVRAGKLLAAFCSYQSFHGMDSPCHKHLG